MLWSQMKLSPYDFSDLRITDKFENRPATGLFLTVFPRVVTYFTGKGRRLYMRTSVDVEISRAPRGARTIFTRIKQISTCNDLYINIIIRNYDSKETGC